MCGSSPPNYLCRLGGYVRPEGAAGLNVVKAPGMVCRLVRTYHPGGVRAPRGGCHAREPASRSPAIDDTGGAVCFHPQESHSVGFESYGERLQEMLGPHPPRTGGRFLHRSLRHAEHLRPSLPYHSERVVSTAINKNDGGWMETHSTGCNFFLLRYVKVRFLRQLLSA